MAERYSPKHREAAEHDVQPSVACTAGERCIAVCPAHTPNYYAAMVAKHRGERAA